MSKLEAIIYILKNKPVMYNVNIKLGKGSELYVPFERNDPRFTNHGLIKGGNFHNTELTVVTPSERKKK